MHKNGELRIMAAIVASGLSHAYGGDTHDAIARRSIAIARAICNQLPDDKELAIAKEAAGVSESES